MSHRYSNIGDNYEESVFPYSSILALKERMNKPILGKGWEELYGRDIPAWSLHRLIIMTPKEIIVNNGVIFPFRGTALMDLTINNCDLYEGMVQIIERCIKEGYFNKEYLV